jgi:hypothetical protein
VSSDAGAPSQAARYAQLRAQRAADELAARQAEWAAECLTRGVDPAAVPLGDWAALRRAQYGA